MSVSLYGSNLAFGQVSITGLSKKRKKKGRDCTTESVDSCYKKPEFGTKVGSTRVYDKATGLPLTADIKREDNVFNMVVGNEVVGIMEVLPGECVAQKHGLPDFYKEYVLGERLKVGDPKQFNKKNILEVKQLSSSGKYYGIGTELIKTAVQESVNTGTKGNLFLIAENNINPEMRFPRQRTDSPDSFYRKLGMQDDHMNGIFYLPQHQVRHYLNLLKENPIIEQ